ncbi:MAG: CopG family ribbon-helix-helix protein [Roseiflexaceae bacterium]
MPQTVTLSTRVTEDFRDQVDALAKALGRDRAWIVEQAIRRFVRDEAEFIAAVQRGREDIQAGRLIEHDEMEAELDQIEAELSPRV